MPRRPKSLGCAVGARFVIVSLALVGGCAEPPGPPAYFMGAEPPGDVPVVFAPGTISLPGRFEQGFAIAPSGELMTFAVTNRDWSAFSLLSFAFEGGRWTEQASPDFLGGDTAALTAAISAEGLLAFFTAARPAYPPSDIWVSRRGPDGWSAPMRAGAPLTSPADEWEVSLARDGTLYFTSTREGGLGDVDIYRAPPDDNGYVRAENLGHPVNTEWGDDVPYIAPDQSYLIFASDRPGGLGFRDLYVSFTRDGGWGEPINLGEPINSSAWELYPSVSPDGRYLFFSRRDGWQTDSDTDILWVSASIIERRRSR